MDRLVKVRLGTFAAEALTAGHKHGTVTTVNDKKATAEGVLKAVRFYLRDKGVKDPGWAYPNMLRGRRVSEDLELELEIDESLWRALKLEANRQEVSIRQLLEHAAVYYAAELDAGRITQRILDDLEDD